MFNIVTVRWTKVDNVYRRRLASDVTLYGGRLRLAKVSRKSGTPWDLTFMLSISAQTVWEKTVTSDLLRLVLSIINKFVINIGRCRASARAGCKDRQGQGLRCKTAQGKPASVSLKQSKSTSTRLMQNGVLLSWMLRRTIGWRSSGYEIDWPCFCLVIKFRWCVHSI